MSYISQTNRSILDPIIDQLRNALVDMELDFLDDNNTQANMNYAITRLLRLVYGTESGYQNINDAVGLLECIKQEHYRKIAAPQAEQAIFDNGDVDATSQPVILNEVTVERHHHSAGDVADTDNQWNRIGEVILGKPDNRKTPEKYR